MGGIAFVVDATVLTLGVELIEVRAEAVRIVAFFAAVLTTWYLNRSYTFQTTTAPSPSEFARYTSAMGLGLAVNFIVFVLLVNLSVLARDFPVLALVPATLSGMTINFITALRILDK